VAEAIKVRVLPALRSLSRLGLWIWWGLPCPTGHKNKVPAHAVLRGGVPPRHRRGVAAAFDMPLAKRVHDRERSKKKHILTN